MRPPGWHRDIARVLAPAVEPGLRLRDLLPAVAATAARSEIAATGEAGTVYLCHPFLVHAAQMHRGSVPRFPAQPPLLPAKEHWMEDPDPDVPVAQAITLALSAGG